MNTSHFKLLVILSLLLMTLHASATTPALCDCKWKHMPVTVYLDFNSREYTTYEIPLKNAMNSWKEVTDGLVYFEQNFFSNKQSDITVEFVSSIEGGEGDLTVVGQAQPLYRDGTMYSCDIQLVIPTGVDGGLVRRVFTHELGHCLGLGHSSQYGSQSIMRPVDIDSGSSYQPTKDDGDALKQIYSFLQATPTQATATPAVSPTPAVSQSPTPNYRVITTATPTPAPATLPAETPKSASTQSQAPDMENVLVIVLVITVTVMAVVVISYREFRK